MLVSSGPTVSLNLRSSGEHTHFWQEGSSTVAGHYHGDLSPQEVTTIPISWLDYTCYVLQVSYEGYFSLASKVVRVWDAVQQKIDDK